MQITKRYLHQVIRYALASATVISLAACDNSYSSSGETNWKVQELALMAQTRCFVTGGHMNTNEAAKFIAQINKEQSGQFQKVYDSLYEGVSKQTNETVEAIIKGGGGCRKMIYSFMESEPETPFKKSLQMYFILQPIQYPDDN